MATARLSELLQRLDAIEGAPEEAAVEVAKVVRSYLARSIHAHSAPDGQKWVLTRKGEEALPTAFEHLQVAAVGRHVQSVLRGPNARHDQGFGRGGLKRPVLVADEIPDQLRKRIAAAIAKELARLGGEP